MRHYAKLLRAALTAVLVAMAGAAIAGPFEDALAAAATGDYSKANFLLRPLADHGNAVAQFDLGFMFDTGRGLLQNYGEAVKWYRLAAEQGNAMAQSNLGSMYANAHSVPQDYTEAAKWYRLAAEQNYTWAQVYLGFFFAAGQGVPKDYVMAHLWLSLATGSRFDPPFGSLQIIDEKERQALRNLAIGARNTLQARMTADQIAQAQKLAHEWKPKSEK